MNTRVKHKGCGGEIRNRKCSRCGKKFGRVGYLVSGAVVKEPVRFDAKEYRRRIREGRDLDR